MSLGTYVFRPLGHGTPSRREARPREEGGHHRQRRGGGFLREHALRWRGRRRFTLDLDAQVLEARGYEREELEAWRAGAGTLDLEDTHGHGTAVLSIL